MIHISIREKLDNRFAIFIYEQNLSLLLPIFLFSPICLLENGLRIICNY